VRWKARCTQRAKRRGQKKRKLHIHDIASNLRPAASYVLKQIVKIFHGDKADDAAWAEATPIWQKAFVEGEKPFVFDALRKKGCRRRRAASAKGRSDRWQDRGAKLRHTFTKQSSMPL
jgi:hypothetical protein